MAAIWRTNVAVMGRDAVPAGKNSVWMSGPSAGSFRPSAFRNRGPCRREVRAPAVSRRARVPRRQPDCQRRRRRCHWPCRAETPEATDGRDLHALRRRKAVPSGMDTDCDDNLRRHVQRLHEHVEMPVRHRIEGAGIKCRGHRTCFRLVMPFVMDGDGSQELCREPEAVPWETAGQKE